MKHITWQREQHDNLRLHIVLNYVEILFNLLTKKTVKNHVREMVLLIHNDTSQSQFTAATTAGTTRQGYRQPNCKASRSKIAL